MRVNEAKELVYNLINRDIQAGNLNILVEPRSPDPSDPGKFLLSGLTARVIHRFSGWHVPICLDWFQDSFSFPTINRGEFYWYVYAIPQHVGFRRPHYFICDFYQMRKWVLEFSAPRGIDHRSHHDWRAGIHRFPDDPQETQAYFRWGDEPVEYVAHTSRVIRLDNVAELQERDRFVGWRDPRGESEAHKRLKLYIAQRPKLVGLSDRVVASLEYSFRTGDRVDILFENHGPRIAAVEVELEGEENMCRNPSGDQVQVSCCCRSPIPAS